MTPITHMQREAFPCKTLEAQERLRISEIDIPFQKKIYLSIFKTMRNSTKKFPPILTQWIEKTYAVLNEYRQQNLCNLRSNFQQS